MCRLWIAPRGTTVAQLMQSMRKAVAGSLRFGKRGRVFDKGVVARKAGGSMALSRSLAGRSRRERGEFRRRIYAARTRLAARPAAGIGPAAFPSASYAVARRVDAAASRLRERGIVISPQIVDVAEHLCLVEHVDHDRFRNENRKTLFDEIYSLYALNDLDTYRYSVSSAGAGGMVQMIPWAYNLERQRHPAAGLLPDFVTAMRNHGNALQAMLLYMQDTWNDLSASEDVQSALVSKIATPTELLAAGYNSNAAKLPSYLRRGGTAWKTLIPRETQMYLQIYKSVESLVPMKSRTAGGEGVRAKS